MYKNYILYRHNKILKFPISLDYCIIRKKNYYSLLNNNAIVCVRTAYRKKNLSQLKKKNVSRYTHKFLYIYVQKKNPPQELFQWVCKRQGYEVSGLHHHLVLLLHKHFFIFFFAVYQKSELDTLLLYEFGSILL